MNTVNRIVIVLFVLISFVLCVALSFAPVQILRGVGGQMVTWGDGLDEQQPWLRIAAGAFFTLLWLVVCFLIIVAEFYRPKPKAVRLEKASGGEVEISLKTIADRIAYDVDQLPGVVKVRPNVVAQRGGVVVELDVETAGEDEVPQQATQIVDVVRRSVEERVGVKLVHAPKVRLRAAPVPGGHPERPGRLERPVLPDSYE